MNGVFPELAQIRRTGSYKMISQTFCNAATVMWQFILGYGPLFDGNIAQGPFLRAVLFVFRLFHFLAIALMLYCVPTFLGILAVVSIIVSFIAFGNMHYFILKV